MFPRWLQAALLSSTTSHSLLPSRAELLVAREAALVFRPVPALETRHTASPGSNRMVDRSSP